jgi:hypothetical protein
MNPNRRFAELAGIEPEQRCSYATGEYYELYPDFSNPIEVLKVMKKREDWFDFVATIGGYQAYQGKPIDDDQSTLVVKFDDEPIEGSEWILVDLLLTPGALRDKASQWMEGKHEVSQK